MYQAESARWRAELEQAMDILRDCQIDTGIPSPGGDYPSASRHWSIATWRTSLLKARVIDPDGTNPRQDFRVQEVVLIGQLGEIGSTLRGSSCRRSRKRPACGCSP
jgi:hypothetical protein